MAFSRIRTFKAFGYELALKMHVSLFMCLRNFLIPLRDLVLEEISLAIVPFFASSCFIFVVSSINAFPLAMHKLKVGPVHSFVCLRLPTMLQVFYCKVNYFKSGNNLSCHQFSVEESCAAVLDDAESHAKGNA
jgi:hypothetical protein